MEAGGEGAPEPIDAPLDLFEDVTAEPKGRRGGAGDWAQGRRHVLEEVMVAVCGVLRFCRPPDQGGD